MVDDILLHLKSHPYWEDFEYLLKSQRPQIPSYDPSTENTEEWKLKSGQQQGFDTCLSILKIEVKHD